MTATLDLEPGLSQPLPVGRVVDLDGRGTTLVRERPGDGAPIVLLHGLTASSGINWIHVFEALPAARRVLAPDLRGHARGLRATRKTTVAEMADDIAALLDASGIAAATIVGFSMGGAVAQELALRHPPRVRALTLVSTTSRFRMSVVSKRLYGMNALAARAARRLPATVVDPLLARFIPHPDPAVRQFIRTETEHHSYWQLSRAAQALAGFRTTHRLGEIAVPTAVMVSTRDRTVHPNAQRRLVEEIPGAQLVESPTGHSGLLWEHDVAVPRLLDAITEAECPR